MRASTIPGPVRVAAGVDLGIAAIYALTTLVGVPDGRLGATLVAGEAATLAAVTLTWVFRPFWSRWSAMFERVLGLDSDGGSPVALAVLPSRRSLVTGFAVFSVLAVVQVLTTTGAGVAFRSVVAAYVVAGALGAAALAVVSDASSLLAATRARD